MQSDLAACAQIHAAAMQHGSVWALTQMAESLTAMGGGGLVAYENEGLQGFLLYRTAADEAELLTLAIHPHHQRNGIGTQLLTRLMADLRENHIAHLFLEVAAANDSARKLYEKCGFIAGAIRKDYYGPDADALVMRRLLSES